MNLSLFTGPYPTEWGLHSTRTAFLILYGLGIFLK